MVSKRNSEIFQRVSNLFYPETLAKRCATFKLMTANGYFSDLTGRTGEVRVWGQRTPRRCGSISSPASLAFRLQLGGGLDRLLGQPGRHHRRASITPIRNAIASDWMGAARVAALTWSSHAECGATSSARSRDMPDCIRGAIDPLFSAFGRCGGIIICHES